MTAILCSHRTIMESPGSPERSVLWDSHCYVQPTLTLGFSVHQAQCSSAIYRALAEGQAVDPSCGPHHAVKLRDTNLLKIT